jgi:hypothetical protein
MCELFISIEPVDPVLPEAVRQKGGQMDPREPAHSGDCSYLAAGRCLCRYNHRVGCAYRKPKTLSAMTRGWAYGNEAADGRVSDPAAVWFPLAAYAASAA